MSMGSGEARRSRRAAAAAADEAFSERERVEEKTRRERIRTQRMFMRQVFARQTGGFMGQGTTASTRDDSNLLG